MLLGLFGSSCAPNAPAPVSAKAPEPVPQPSYAPVLFPPLEPEVSRVASRDEADLADLVARISNLVSDHAHAVPQESSKEPVPLK